MAAARRCASRAEPVPPMRRKGDLPVKTCSVCARPFTWRKRWTLVWETIETCSDRCRDEARRRKRAGADGG